MSDQFKVLDLFSGIGGFSLGLEQTGRFRTVAFCEINGHCQRVLHRHWPNTYIHSDIKTLTAKHFEGWEVPDVITGGFPCQDVSQAKTNGAEGLDGKRSGLWGEMRRLICELRPRYAIVENVSALLYRGMGRVLGDLAEGGYDAEWDCIPAAAVGAPHIRDRVFILAYPRSEPRTFRLPSIDGRGDMGQEGNDGGEAKRGENRKLIALVPGVHPRTPADWWRAQSTVARTAHGIPDRLERLHAAGNSIVPQIAAWIGARIVEAESLLSSPAATVTNPTTELDAARKD